MVAIVLVLAVLGGGGMYFLGGSQTAAAETAYSTAEVTRMDITSSITGSGTLEAADSYSATTLLEDTTLTADFEEGDEVKEGTVLYTIDSSDAANSLEQAEISLNQAQRSYNNALKNQADLTITAPTAGQVYSIDVEVGDEVNAGETVATIRDSATMSLEVTFPADDAASFYVGQSAAVTLDSTFETLSGTISEISGTDTVLTGNVIVRSVTIDVSNPGGLSTTQTASAAVGSVTSTSSGTFTYQVGLGEKWRHKPMELSGGQQRASIARALVGHPPGRRRRRREARMSILESLELALKNIVSSKVRTLLTMLGIIGVAAVIVIMGLGSGLEGCVTDSFSDLGTNTLTVTVMSRGSTRSLDAEDMYGIVEESSEYLDKCSPTVPIMGYVKISSETVDSTSSMG